MSFSKKSESYDSGSKGIDYNSVADGTEISQNYINTNEQSNGDDQGFNYDTSRANHPKTPFGETGHYTFDSSTSPASNKDDEDGGEPELAYPQQGVDDNHADGGSIGLEASLGFLNLFKKSSDDSADFFTNQTIGGPADSPQKMHDGINPADINIVRPVSNNYVSQTDECSSLLATDPSIVDNKKDNTPEINKGRQAKFNPYFYSHIGFKKIAEGEPNTRPTDSSNVEDIMNPSEEKNKHERVTHDCFDEGRTLKDQTLMVTNPLNQGLGLDEENMYSGVDHSASKGFLSLFDKKADYSGEMPSVNPNSGKDEEYPDSAGENTTVDNPVVMSDGKNAADSCNENDKADYDVSKARRKIVYKDRVENTDSYFNLLNSGGGFGGEGDTVNFSGVDNT